MTPLEEQVEKLTRYRVTQDVDGGWSEPKEMVVLDDLRALLPLEVTDEMKEAGAKALWASRYPDGPPWEEWWEDHEAYLRYSRACLSTALTQKGDNK